MPIFITFSKSSGLLIHGLICIGIICKNIETNLLFGISNNIRVRTFFTETWLNSKPAISLMWLIYRQIDPTNKAVNLISDLTFSQ